MLSHLKIFLLHLKPSSKDPHHVLFERKIRAYLIIKITAGNAVSMRDYEVVLTADRSFMSDYHLLPFLRGIRFASTRILNPSIFSRFVGPQVPRTDKGRVSKKHMKNY